MRRGREMKLERERRKREETRWGNERERHTWKEVKEETGKLAMQRQGRRKKGRDL